jgi:(2R)-ethylmalonyl-CoA mutase
LIGISILSGSHLVLVPQILDKLRAAGLGNVPLVVGGIIPEADARALEQKGVARVFTPKDFALNNIMSDLVDLVASRVHPHAAE